MLLWASVFLAVCILVKVAGFFVVSAKAERLVKKAVAQSKADPNDMEKYFAKSKAIAGELKKNNLFVPPAPKQHPVKEVLGILGDEVLIKDKWYKVGDKIGDAKIVAVGPAQVKIEWDGKEKSFAPIDAASTQKPAAPKGAKKPEVKAAGEQPPPRPEPGPMPGRRGRGGFFNLSPEERAALRERMRNASPEERAELMAQMRERSGGGSRN